MHKLRLMHSCHKKKKKKKKKKRDPIGILLSRRLRQRAMNPQTGIAYENYTYTIYPTYEH